jgi:N-methylhydantoinase A/oxoprolinase/acetone carboxylase beta subunit
MQGEGFAPSSVPLAFEVETSRGNATVEGPAGLDPSEFSNRILEKVNGASLGTLRASATGATPNWRQHPLPLVSHTVQARATRHVWWDIAGPAPTGIYDREALKPGASIEGPAIVEAPDTTYAVNPGWTLVVNELAFFIISRANGEQ